MSTYSAKIHWQIENGDFLKNRYSRAHTWSFDGGIIVPASSSPSVVPTPWSTAENVDPEEAYVASLSSCHMLWFLSIAAAKDINVTRYTDSAIGTMSRNTQGKLAITEVELKPVITLNEQAQLATSELEMLHHLAHEECFIANSVITKIVIHPSISSAT